jgi:hypothetical protein
MDPENTLSNLLSIYLLIKPPHAVTILICCRFLSLVGLQEPYFLHYILGYSIYNLLDSNLM